MNNFEKLSTLAEKLKKEEKKELVGKLVQLNDGTGRSGVITSTRGLFFPRKEAEGDIPEGYFCDVKLARRDGSYEEEPTELNGRAFELALVKFK